MAWAGTRGQGNEESQTLSAPGKFYVQHVHASLFDFDDAVNRKVFFYWNTPTLLLVDEAHEMTLKRQQSKLKTIPNRPDLTLVLITSEPDQIEASIRDRCAKIRLGPLSARELEPMVERACRVRGIAFDSAITQALNRAEIFRPRAILNVVDSLSRGVPLGQAVVRPIVPEHGPGSLRVRAHLRAAPGQAATLPRPALADRLFSPQYTECYTGVTFFDAG